LKTLIGFTFLVIALITLSYEGKPLPLRSDREEPRGQATLERRDLRTRQTGPSVPHTFSEVAQQAGIRFRHQASHTSQKYMIEPMAAGVAWLDFDSDGLLDLFFVNGAALDDPMPKGKLPVKSDPQYWNRLYRNRGNGTFVDVTERSGLQGEGYGMGVAVGDYDNDGKPDLYVTNFGRNLLYHNKGNGTYEEVTERARVTGKGWCSGAAFLDYDRDGYLDLIVSRYADWDFDNNPWCGPERLKLRGYCHPNVFQSVTHLLYHNQRDGTFLEVSERARIASHPGKGLGIAVNDFDQDGWPDILVANDTVAEQLFRNNGDGTFSEMGLLKGVAYNSNGQAFAGMGADFEDYNNDGWPDILLNALSLQGYVLFRNKRGEFEDVSEETGITRITMPYSGWGMKFFDYDDDGWKDVFVAQGHVLDTISIDFPNIPYKQRLLMMRNQGGKFEDVSDQSGPAFREPQAARGVAFGDFDNDGFVDLVVNINDGSPMLLRNNGSGQRWIIVDTVGSSSNRDGIGAKVRMVSESGAEQYGFVSTASSYLSASDKRVHFGVGKDRRIKSLEIRWPSGIVQELKDVETNQVLTVKESAQAVIR
jgi:enediyne biosynthesis protein E4